MTDKELEKIKRKMMDNLLKKSETQHSLHQGKIHELDESIFHRFISESPNPVILDFWAEWCYPCKLMTPIFQNLALKYTGRVDFAKLNVDHNQRIASQYNVMSIPNFILFKNGKPLEQVMGAVGQGKLEALLLRHL